MQPISHSIRRLALAGAAVLVLGGAAVGIAAAQAQPATTPSGQQSGYQRFIDALAKRLLGNGPPEGRSRLGVYLRRLVLDRDVLR